MFDMFDLFNKNALKEKTNDLIEVKYELAIAKKQIATDKIKIDELEEEVNQLTSKLRGDRVCDGYCSLCRHGVEGIGYSTRFGDYQKWSCTLDCKCKEFEKKEC